MLILNMNIFKKFQFWIPLVYIFIGLFNLIGLDEKNILLFFTSPPSWIAETHWFVSNFTNPANIPLILILLITLIFWYLVGLLIDWIIKRAFSRKSKKSK